MAWINRFSKTTQKMKDKIAPQGVLYLKKKSNMRK